MPRSISRPKRNNRKVVSRKPKVTRNRHRVTAFVRKNWDDRLTATQNLERLGLKADLNSAKELAATTADAAAEASLETRPGDTVPPRVNAARPRFYVHELEAAYIDSLEKAHGSNYIAMQRDIKTNSLQWTAARCEGKIERLRKFRAGERARKLAEAEAADAKAAAREDSPAGDDSDEEDEEDEE